MGVFPSHLTDDMLDAVKRDRSRQFDLFIERSESFLVDLFNNVPGYGCGIAKSICPHVVAHLMESPSSRMLQIARRQRDVQKFQISALDELCIVRRIEESSKVVATPKILKLRDKIKRVIEVYNIFVFDIQAAWIQNWKNQMLENEWFPELSPDVSHAQAYRCITLAELHEFL